MTPLIERLVANAKLLRSTLEWPVGATANLHDEAAERIQALEAELSIAKRGLSGLAVYPGSGAGARKIASEILARMTNA